MTQYALITGAARRIGAEIAKYLHAKGYVVLIHSRQSSAENLCAELNHIRADSAFAYYADLVDPIARQTLVEQIRLKCPQLDLLVNNASVFYKDPNLDDLKRLEQMTINAEVPYQLSLALSDLLSGAEDPLIVNIADIHAKLPLTDFSHYTASKAALLQYSKQLAKQLAPKIRVNVVSPGAILWPEHANEMQESTKQKIIAQTPLQKSGSPLDIAKAVYAFATLPFVTGQELVVDGGRTLKH